MRIRFFLLCLLALTTVTAQSDLDTVPVPKTHYHYIGIQANQLLQQFISFNSNSSINTNPFLFTYASNNIRTGEGFAFGAGFLVTDNNTNDGVNEVSTRNVNFSMRLGYEKK